MTAQAKVCTAVENRLPADEVPAAGTSATQVYCWVNLVSATIPTTIKTVWYNEGKRVDAVSLAVKSSPYRTWSSKKVWPGQWKVEVVTEAGDVLASKEFKVN